MSTLTKKRLASDEYLALERGAEFKSEYFDGEIFMMAGATETHNLIVGNIISTLNTQLRTRDCHVYPSDMRIKVSALDKYTYPDVSVVCSKREFEDSHNDILLNPSLIFEVLSKTTEAYDRGKKFEHYQYIGSFSEYILVAQDGIRVEQYVRQSDRTWTYREYHEREDVVRLESIGCDLALTEVYLKVFND